MPYIAHICLDWFPRVDEEIRMVDGEEQVCLVLPTKLNQLKRTNQNRWMLGLFMQDEPPNAKMISHDVRIMPLSRAWEKKLKNLGLGKKFLSIGRMRIYQYDESKRLIKKSGLEKVVYEGVICLDYVPKQSLVEGERKSKARSFRCTFKPKESSPDWLAEGFVNIDALPPTEIFQNKDTGKRYVKCLFKTMEEKDNYNNTHQLVVKMQGGAEIEVGRFQMFVKEKPKSTQAAPPPTTPKESDDDSEHNTGVNQRTTPQYIDGYKF